MLDQKVKLDKDARREAILDVASEIFYEEGFDAASMSSIAQRLGGSKGTLYNYFKSKEDLVEAFVQRHCAVHQSEIEGLLLADKGHYRDSLLSWGRKYARITTREKTQRNFRLITSIAERWPDVARLFYQAGPLKGAERMVEFLKKAEAAGEFKFDDVELATHQFIALCQNRHLKARFMNYGEPPSEAQIDAEVTSAVKVFYAAYGV
ncbi:TetR family transcriptional regulator [Asticcacaulis endophyticus]|uniref:TetR family transcriptional regulator n=1 Tax=Asticcacaulis endophyticus TaxID=1395890 RepID=A0A918UPR7_9CAUL|nr:TetR family transcriptional regulator [Asticcacaulis endophyticus]